MARHSGIHVGPFAKAILAFAIALISGHSRGAAYLSPPTPIDPPGITTNLPRRTRPIVAVSGTSALFGYLETPTIPGTTNATAVGIDWSGNMVELVGRRVGEPSYASLFQLYAVSNGFFSVYLYENARTSPTLPLIASRRYRRISLDGKPLTAPATLTPTNANSSSSYPIAYGTDGRSLLSVTRQSDGYSIERINWDDSRAQTHFAAATPSNTALLASSGTNDLLVWPITGGFRSAAIDAETLSVTTNAPVDTGFTPTFSGLGSNGGEYLVIVRDISETPPQSFQSIAHLFRLDGAGHLIGSLVVTNDFESSGVVRIVPRAGGWTVFDVYQAASPVIHSYDVLVSGDSLVTAPGPISKVQGSSIAEFGSGRYIVGVPISGGRVGYTIVTTNSVSEIRAPLAMERQLYTTVASSPVGYFAAWLQIGDRTNLLGMRFRNDGTRIDQSPIVFTNALTTPPYHAILDNDRYHLFTRDSARSILIDLEGPPNLQTNKGPTAASSYPDFGATMFKGAAITFPVAQYQLILTGSGPMLLRYMFPNLTFDVVADANSPFEFTHDLGTSYDMAATQLGTNFFLTWNSYGDVLGAKVVNGVISRTNLLARSFAIDTPLSVAASGATAAIAVAKPNDGSFFTTNTFFLYNTETENTVSISEVVARTNAPISIAPLGKDFVIADTLFDDFTTYAAVQFLSATPAPGVEVTLSDATSAHVAITGLAIDRTYLLQRSANLIDWKTIDTITGETSYTNVEAASATAAFYRTILSP